MNYEFVNSTQHTTTVRVFGKAEKFELLGLFPFTSDRKRMSIVVREYERNGSLIKMYTKGADNIIKQRLARDNQLNLDDELNRFSVIGLRTLLIGMRVISEKEWQEFQTRTAALPLKDRDKALE